MNLLPGGAVAVRHLVYLYNSRSALSIRLLDRLRETTPDQGVTVWCDRDTLDAGFDSELTSNLRRADAIILAVSSEGLGRYQAINEIGRVVDALRINFTRRLVLAFVGGAEPTPALDIFDQFGDRIDRIALAADDASIDGVLRACFPDMSSGPDTGPPGPEGELALKLMERFRRRRDLVIVVGPYAFAEGEYRQATPAKAIERFVTTNQLEGAPPWIDVMGSVAQSMRGDIDERLEKILSALRGEETYDQSGLGVYLRLIAANWQKKPGLGKLCIINTMPDEWIDLALGSTDLPVEHVKLIHNARETERLQVQRLRVVNGHPHEENCAPDDPDLADSRIVLIKPFGSIANEAAARKAMLTAEHWRLGVQPMPVPTWATDGMTTSVLLVLGAGIFTPNVQMLFRTLLPAALEQKDDNPYRFLVHSPHVEAEDPLHKIEAHLIRNRQGNFGQFPKWVWDNYKLEVQAIDPLKLLVWIEHYLKDAA